MITSAQIRSNPNDFEPFLTHPDTGEKMGTKEFCETFVEVLGKEAGEQLVLLFPASQSRLTTPRPSPRVLIKKYYCAGVFFSL